MGTGKKYKIVKLIDSKREKKENSLKMTETFDNFYKDLKATEKADSVLTPTQQIDRKLAIEDVRKKYRRLSILVHPDKNQDDPERAQAAFDALKKAYELLSDDTLRKKCFELV